MATYSPLRIANYFLEKGFEDEAGDMTPMKLQKLVYYAHGWHLAQDDEPLIDELVECWQYGPVVPSLFHRFKRYGGQPIDDYGRLYRTATEKDRRANRPILRLLGKSYVLVKPVLPKSDSDTREFLDSIWNAYSGFSPTKLSNMTHRPGTPWTQVYKQYDGRPPKGKDIPNEIIKEYFERLRSPNERPN